MNDYSIVTPSQQEELLLLAAEWFHSKWGVQKEAYAESMRESNCKDSPVPQWYVVMDGDKIIAGAGVIENDFHNRRDLTPNICALYVEKEYRNRGIAGRLLCHIRRDMSERGASTLYLLTEHEGFYERYGWEFLCMAQGDGESHMSRMYMCRTQ